MEKKTPRDQRASRRARRAAILNFLIPVAFFLGVGAGYLLRDVLSPAEVNWEDNIQRVDVSTDDDPSIGPKNAPITIIEFSDYQCPYCQVWHENVYSQLMAKYPNKIRFVYRDLPLSFHPEALPAAVAANCAGEQDAYWDFHGALFSSKYSLGREAYLNYAAELGLDVDTFTECIDSGRMEAEVKADAAAASKVGLDGTPSFVINGRIVVGALPLEDFVALIEEELAK